MPCNHKTSFILPSKHAREIEKTWKKVFFTKCSYHFRFIYWFLWTSKITLEWIFSNTFLENAFRYMYGRSFKSFFYRTKGVSWLKQILLTFLQRNVLFITVAFALFCTLFQFAFIHTKCYHFCIKRYGGEAFYTYHLENGCKSSNTICLAIIYIKVNSTN